MLKIMTAEAYQGKVKASSVYMEHPIEGAVRKIISAVRQRGDSALVDLAKQYDGVDMKKSEIKVSAKETKEAYKKVRDGFIKALSRAINNIKEYHKKQKPDEFFETQENDVIIGLRAIPLENVGVYVPGGAAAYPSSVLMGVIPAQIAGVKKIVIATPPAQIGKNTGVNPYVLVAANELGIADVYKVGGAQAMAALAFGTKTIPQVDKIVGPGNTYVTLAKKILYGAVGIDKLAGPSDVVIMADQDAEAEFIAADILSQAEHDRASSAVLITNSKELAQKVNSELVKQLKKLNRRKILEPALGNSCIVLVKSLKDGVNIINHIGPEHLELFTSSPQMLLEGIKNAGAVFLGPYSPVAVGDYYAGPNHVLPTDGSSRFSSPLTVYDFIKYQSIIGYTKPALNAAWKDVKLLAEVEGLDAHARSVEIRFK